MSPLKMQTRWYFVDSEMVIALHPEWGTPVAWPRNGHLSKEHVQEMAERAGLEITGKKDGLFTLKERRC